MVSSVKSIFFSNLNRFLEDNKIISELRNHFY